MISAHLSGSYFKILNVLYLGKPQKVLKITNTQNCGFLQGKAGFAPFYFQKLPRFYLKQQGFLFFYKTIAGITSLVHGE